MFQTLALATIGLLFEFTRYLEFEKRNVKSDSEELTGDDSLAALVRSFLKDKNYFYKETETKKDVESGDDNASKKSNNNKKNDSNNDEDDIPEFLKPKSRNPWDM